MLTSTKIKSLQSKYIHPRGFTLLELLVVIAILAILLSVGFVFFQRAQQNARDQQRIADLSNVKIALEQYFSDDNFAYPTSDPSGRIWELGICAGAPLDWGSEPLTCGGTTYMKILPQDPGGTPQYCYISTGPSFDLYAQMENDNNASANPPFTCGGITDGYDYIVESEE